MKLSDKEQKMFLIFLEALVTMGVNNSEKYNEAIEKFNEKSRKNNNPVNLEAIVIEASEFLANSMPSFKSTQWPEFKEKKGFDILYNYAPDKVKKILRNGEGKEHILGLYSDRHKVLSMLAKAGIQVVNGSIKKEDKEKALKILSYCATTKPDDALNNEKVSFEKDEKVFPDTIKSDEVLDLMNNESNSIGYFNHPLRNPSRFYKHVAAMCKATDQALANIVTQYPYFVTMSYLDSEQSIQDAHSLNSTISVNDGQRDIFKKAESFFEKKLNAWQSSKACENLKELYTTKSEKIPAIAAEIIPLIIDVDKQYVKYFNDYNNQKSTFNFVDYVQRQLGHEVKWDEDGYFLVYAPKKMKKTIEQEMGKYLPNLIAAEVEDDDSFNSLAKKVNGKKYKAKLVKTKACIFKAGHSEVYAEITDGNAPTEVYGCMLIAEMIKNNALKDIKANDEVQVALSVSKRSIRIKNITKCEAGIFAIPAGDGVYLGDEKDNNVLDYKDNTEKGDALENTESAFVKTDYEDYIQEPTSSKNCIRCKGDGCRCGGHCQDCQDHDAGLHEKQVEAGGNDVNTMLDFFWENYPSEISFDELREINPSLYKDVVKIGKELVELGELDPKHLCVEKDEDSMENCGVEITDDKTDADYERCQSCGEVTCSCAAVSDDAIKRRVMAGLVK